MMTLTVLTTPIPDTTNAFRVTWKTGGTRSGLVNVTMHADVSDPLIAAELYAAHWLLTIKEVLGSKRSGTGVKIVFSRGAVKKLIRKDSSKVDLAIYARYLTTRFDKAVLEVSKDVFELTDTASEDAIHVNEPPQTLVDAGNLGTIEISEHAIDRYVERSNSGEISNAWPSLLKRLANKEMRQVTLSDELLRKKKAKYQAGQEIWKHPDDTTHYVVVRNNVGVGTLVTVFDRKDFH